MSRSLAIPGYFRKHQMVGGVASVFQNLSRGIEAVLATDDQYRDLKVVVFHGPAGTPYRSAAFEYLETGDRLGRFAAESRMAALRGSDFDAILFPNYFTPPIVRARRAVTVIHDLLHVRFPEVVPWRKRLWLTAAQHWTLRRADAVVTITSSVRDDVLERYGKRWSDQVTPIWNPIAFDRLDGTATQQVTAGRPYLLGVAVDRPSKNLSTLIRAFKLLRERAPDHCLVLVGELRSSRPARERNIGQAESKLPSTVELVRDLGLTEHVKITGFVTDEELGALYRGASAFVLPSLLEGFGMPPIEAMALGVPTLVTDIPPLREVTMGRAHYLSDPMNAAELAQRILAIIEAGGEAKPTAETVSLFRESYAPPTIARRYLELLLPS
jgi:glycosyltransferase involved in cell wall biosynthesis